MGGSSHSSDFFLKLKHFTFVIEYKIIAAVCPRILNSTLLASPQNLSFSNIFGKMNRNGPVHVKNVPLRHLVTNGSEQGLGAPCTPFRGVALAALPGGLRRLKMMLVMEGNEVLPGRGPWERGKPELPLQ